MFLLYIEGAWGIIRRKIVVYADPINKVAIYKLKVKYRCTFKTNIRNSQSQEIDIFSYLTDDVPYRTK